MQEPASPTINTREIVFIALTALLSLAVIFAVLFAVSRFRSTKLSPLKSLVLDEQRTRASTDKNVVCDSEKAMQYSDYPTMESQLPFVSFRSVHPQEQDIALAHSRTTSFSFQLHSRQNSVETVESKHGISRRARQDSFYSEPSTPSLDTVSSDFIDNTAFSSASGSSKTSIVTVLVDSLFGDDDGDENEEVEEEYEVQRVHTQSVEIQRGVLVDCRASQIILPVSDNLEAIPRYSRILAIQDPNRLSVASSCPSNKCFVTEPSATSLASSVSVDLADFPLPPSCVV